MTVLEIFARVVTNSNITAEYFWDEMSVNEANAIIDSVTDKDRTSWEQTRWLAYVNCLSQGAKLKTPQDLITFSWEKEEIEALTPKDTRTPEEVRQSLLDIKNSL